jgi:aminoglycoside phosphotransferase (APT) family kinase protein
MTAVTLGSTASQGDTDLAPRYVDRDALAAVIRPWLGTTLGDIKVEELVGGLSNVTLRVSSGADRWIVRRRPHGQVAAMTHDMNREFTVLRALENSGLPTPRVYGYCEDPGPVGAPFYLSSFIDGTVFHTKDDADGLTAVAARRCSDRIIDLLVDLHRVPTDTAPLSNWRRAEPFVTRRIGGWLKQWRATAHRDLAYVESAGEQLLKRAPVSGAQTLVHGDFRLGNMLIDHRADDARINGLLDWEMATVGDPLTDLAHLIVYSEPMFGITTHPSQSLADISGFMTGAEYVDAYASKSGLDPAGIEFYFAFEHWRAAIIKEGIAQRALSTNTDRDRAVALHYAVEGHLDITAMLLAALEVHA